jgi:type I restriction-modification system DNA methylase subunit
MKYTTIRIEGAILSADILDKIEQGDIGGRLARDFGFDTKIKVKDEIARAWADAQDLWRIFKRQKERVAEQEYGTTETRKYWIIPLLGLFGYDAQLSKAETVHGKSYAVSHRTANLDRFPIHIVGFNDSLDEKRTDSGPRMSPHALLQEYINLTEHLYAIITNGIHLRLLRNSSRLIRLSFIEFDLETMMEEEHYADFAIMYRLLHSSRMPAKMDQGAESLIEKYHQDALDSGSRIREGLSDAVKISIRSLANGFLKHADNKELRKQIDNEEISAPAFYQYQLRLIYRILFLMVIEERNLIFPDNADKTKREIYYQYYSVNHLRKLCEKLYLADQRFNDLWIALKNTFHLFESEIKGKHLGLSPLAGDLFGYNAIDILNKCNLDNKILLECLRSLSVFNNKKTGQKMRVNYASLNVEEFGSVYEGMLEYDPMITKQAGVYQFDFVKGSARSSSGSHYTPDELVQPLIKHSLDYIIEDRLKSSDKKSEKEKALLSIKVCDVACGSGHILLNAARRIGAELAKVRTGEDQPSPAPLRQAIRDVIKSCIYGVDKNRLAVELCKVSLWLEAHNPGEPLNFLDHHIKCGDAIVGLAHKEELENGIADEAFKKMPDDDKDIRVELAKRNKTERKSAEKRKIFYEHSEFGSIDRSFTDISKVFESFNRLPENSIKEIEHKRIEYKRLSSGDNWWRLKTLADIQVAQFFIPKNETNANKIVTDAEYRDFLGGRKPMQGPKVGKAMGAAQEKRFFHYFLEFPVVFAEGGFDCILGNPPYLGGQALSGTFGHSFCEWTRYAFAPAKGCDLVTFFLRRNYQIVKDSGFNAIITTNSIIDGKTREGGLDVIVRDQGGSINFAVRSTRWPGAANLFVSLLGVIKDKWKGLRQLDGKTVDYISSFFEDYLDVGKPIELHQNKDQMFQGSIFLGDGFLLSYQERDRLLAAEPKNTEVIFPVINGKEVNNDPEQRPGRCIINFFDWSREHAETFSEPFESVLNKVKPVRDKVKRKSNREKWWIYAEHRPGLLDGLKKVKHCFLTAATTKHLSFSLSPTDRVFTHALYVYVNNKFSKISILQSTLHNEWARKYSGALKLDLRYSPSNCFVTFPFPQSLLDEMETELERLGEEYHEFRQKLMLKMKLGLTKTYNQLHNPDLRGFSTDDIAIISTMKDKEFQKQYGKETVNLWKHLKKTEGVYTFNEAVKHILHLRELHKQMDETVLKAYCWEDIDLAHDFYEVDYLPENDRVRYTISPDARKEVLKRLLKLNHEIHEQEVKAGLYVKRKSKKKQKADASGQMKLF